MNPALRDTSALESRIVIHAPSGLDAKLIVRLLSEAGFEAEESGTFAELCADIEAGVGAALLSEEVLSQENIEHLRRVVQAQPAWSDIPFFVLTASDGEASDTARLNRIASIGNTSFLERPLRTESILAAFRMALRARAHQIQIRDLLQQTRGASKAQREREHYYRTLIESLPQLVWTCLPNGRCDYLSAQWVAYTGIPEEEQLGLQWVDLVLHPDDRERTVHAWTAAFQDTAPYDLEYRIRRFDGSYRWFKTRGLPVRSASGVIQKWFGTCTDIQDEKAASEERRVLLAREQAARKVAERLNRVGPTLILERDPERLAEQVAELSTALVGAGCGAFAYRQNGSSTEGVLGWIFTGARDDARAPFTLSKATGLLECDSLPQRSLRVPDMWETPGIAASHPFRHVVHTCLDFRSYMEIPVFSRSGSVLGGLYFGAPRLGAFTDFHQKLAEGVAAQTGIALDNARLFAVADDAQRTLRTTNAELLRANEDLNQFAYSASHDLREPLRMVAIYTQLLQRHYGEQLDKRGTEYLSFVLQGARRLDRLLRDLLSYTQVASEANVDFEPVDSAKVLDHALENLHAAVEENHGLIRTGELPILTVKEIHLLQLFQNLIGNSLKYKSEDPPEIVISATPYEGGDGPIPSAGATTTWKIAIRDNGIGIAPEHARKVFGIFTRLHSGREQYDGTGIGLAICQRIVERYNGRIWVESEGPGRGSEFCFTLPGA